MKIYLGDKQVKLIINDTVSKLYIGSSTLGGEELLSFDNYILKSSDNYYLISKEGEVNG